MQNVNYKWRKYSYGSDSGVRLDLASLWQRMRIWMDSFKHVAALHIIDKDTVEILLYACSGIPEHVSLDDVSLEYMV